MFAFLDEKFLTRRFSDSAKFRGWIALKYEAAPPALRGLRRPWNFDVWVSEGELNTGGGACVECPRGIDNLTRIVDMLDEALASNESAKTYLNMPTSKQATGLARPSVRHMVLT